MTRIDFYVLDRPEPGAAWTAACRLAEKAFRMGQRVYAHVADEETARRLDQLMWAFRAGSFVPHAQAGRLSPETMQGPQALPAPVLIGCGEEPPADHWDLLINLTAEVPLFFSRYRRLAEVVGGDAEQREQGRLRYRFYRDRGYELHTHRL